MYNIKICTFNSHDSLSTYLFSICYDRLIERLKSSAAGVYLNKTFVQCVIYADDVFLCSASISGLHALYNIVLDFCHVHDDISLNDKKSFIIRLGTKRKSPISFSGLPTEYSITYLGCCVSNSRTDLDDLIRARNTIYGRTNNLLRQNLLTPFQQPCEKRIAI